MLHKPSAFTLLDYHILKLLSVHQRKERFRNIGLFYWCYHCMPAWLEWANKLEIVPLCVPRRHA